MLLLTITITMAMIVAVIAMMAKMALAISRVDSASWKIGGTSLLFFLTSVIALVTTIGCWAFR